jgi:hypothetical protein
LGYKTLNQSCEVVDFVIDAFDIFLDGFNVFFILEFVNFAPDEMFGVLLLVVFVLGDPEHEGLEVENDTT